MGRGALHRELEVLLGQCFERGLGNDVLAGFQNLARKTAEEEP
jgi:hypothetical protein